MADERTISPYVQRLAGLILDPSNREIPMLVEREHLSKPPKADTTTFMRLAGRLVVDPNDRYQDIRMTLTEDLALTEDQIAALRADPRGRVDSSNIDEVKIQVELINRRLLRGLTPGFTLLAKPDGSVNFLYSPGYSPDLRDDRIGRARLLIAFRRGAKAPPPLQPRRR